MMADSIARICANPKWGGGIHKEHLAYLLGIRPARRAEFDRALMIAYRQKKIQFCWSYVCPGSAYRTVTHKPV